MILLSPRAGGLILLLLHAVILFPLARAQILVSTHLSSCLNQQDDSITAPIDSQLVFTHLYAQFDQGQTRPGQHSHLDASAETAPATLNSNSSSALDSNIIRFVLTGTTNSTSQGYSNATSFLSTLVLDSQVLTFPISSNQSALCNSIRDSTYSTSTVNDSTSASGCPYGPGDIALGFSLPLGDSYPLSTITTQLLVLDPSVSALHLACYNFAVTPYYPSYFAYTLIRYLVVAALAIFLILYLVARAWASRTDFIHETETQLASSLTLKLTSSTNDVLSKRKVWASIWFGAWAGRQVVGSGSLRRFVTAEFRELWGTIIWFSLVGTVAVDWPEFAYPVFARTAWSTLIYKSNLPFVTSAPPLLPTDNFQAPSIFAAQMADTLSPLYLNSSVPPVLMDLTGAKRGIEKWSTAIGVDPLSLFPICGFTFLVICGAVVLFHAACWAFDVTLDRVKPPKRGHKRLRGGSSGASAAGGSTQGGGASVGGGQDGSFSTMKETKSFRGQQDGYDSGEESYLSHHQQLGIDGVLAEEEEEEAEYATRPRPEDDYPSWRLHLALLQGNLTRVLLLFHLPLSLFSTFQIAHKSTSSTSSFILAILSLGLICFLAPFLILLKMHQKSIRELYTSLPLLLSLGPLYNTYSEECSMFSAVRIVTNLMVGVVIGAAQSVGIAQAAVVLLTEVADTLVTSLWLPWGDNAAMGPLAFVLSIARIIIAVLLVVLSPSVNVSLSAASWLAYIVFLIQALVVLLWYFVLVFKVTELVVRFIGDIPFDESRNPRVGGLFGALRRWDGGKTGRGGKKRRHHNGVRQREIEERRRRNQQYRTQGSEGTMNSQSRMNQENHRRGNSSLSVPRSVSTYGGELQASSAYSSRSGGGSGGPGSKQMPFAEDDGYIMSAMSSGQWGGASSPGYVKPGAYSTLTHQQPHQQPILRSGPVYHEHATVVPAPTAFAPSPNQASTSTFAIPPPPPQATSNSGFSRVGGGRASSNNPYQLAKKPQQGYPPYPPGSSDLYNTPSSSNLRRMSQSAVIELAAPPSPSDQQPGIRSRPPSGSLPSSSNLLSNASTPYRPERQPPKVLPPKAPKGFFGRFKKQKQFGGSEGDFWSDDAISDESEDEEDERTAAAKMRKGRGWGMFGGLGKKVEEKKGEESEEEVDGGGGKETGFSVVRKARPRPSPNNSQGGGVGGSNGGVPSTTSPLLPASNSTMPIVSIEGPSQPSTPTATGFLGEEHEGEQGEWGHAR